MREKRKTFAVIDTNVLVSALLKPGSVPDEVIEEIRGDYLIPVLDSYLMTEYREVLHRGKFHFSQERIDGLVLLFKEKGIYIVSDSVAVQELNDTKDQKIYELYLSSAKKTETLLITGNLKHFPVETGILSPRMYLDRYGNREDQYEF